MRLIIFLILLATSSVSQMAQAGFLAPEHDWIGSDSRGNSLSCKYLHTDALTRSFYNCEFEEAVTSLVGAMATHPSVVMECGLYHASKISNCTPATADRLTFNVKSAASDTGFITCFTNHFKSDLNNLFCANSVNGF